MAVHTTHHAALPVIGDREKFDQSSGMWLERVIFNHRLWVIFLCALVTLGLAYQATKLEINASFEKLIPQSHSYIQNYLNSKKELPGLGNTVRIVLENRQGTILDPAYLETLRQANDALYLIPGVDRSWMKSIWMPIVRWTEVTEEGIAGGPVMPADFNGSAKSLATLREHIGKSGIVGTLVAGDFKSSMIVAPLLETYPGSDKSLDYREFSHALEGKIRALQSDKVNVYIVGFGKLVGDFIDGLWKVITYFAISAAIAAAIILFYTRCWRSTALLVSSALLGVVWLLGLMHVLGFVLDPYSILVPFLIFAIGLSHGAQKMNGIMQDIGRGTDKYVAARYTFRRLFLTGLTALLTNVVGFAVLMVIDIPVIKEMALATSIGVGILIFTKLILVPVLLSYIGVSKTAAARSLRADSAEQQGRGVGAVWLFLERFTERRRAIAAISIALCLALAGFMVSLHLQIGDLDPGAPELRQNSRYNLDSAYVTEHYGMSSDQFAVIVKTSEEGCRLYQNLTEMDRLSAELQRLPGVQHIGALSETGRFISSALFEGSGKWFTLSRNQRILDSSVTAAMISTPDVTNMSCSITPLIVYLSDHKAATLERVLHTVEQFAAQHNSAQIQFLPVAGSAGIEAVTNIVVKHANRIILMLLYAAVVVLCFITFRSWRAVVVALVPLLITSVLCEALMVMLGIGVKVATLPVIALGVGVGVDYALYLLSVQLAAQREGLPLTAAYHRAVQSTGKVVGLIGMTLAAGVVTWALSPIKFQADMGILLTFMFLWNMLGALILIPALSHFLLQTVQPDAPAAGAPVSDPASADLEPALVNSSH